MTTATPSNSSSSSAQGGGQPESALPEAFLLLKRDVFTAYLQPLLKKHEMGTLIQYEDLTSSWQAAIATLGRASTDSSSSTTTTTTQKEHVSTVREQLTALHQGQVRAYREAGRIALMEWADTFQLPSSVDTMNKDESDLSAYQKHCRTLAEEHRPNWQVNKPIIAQALQRIEERAVAEFHKIIKQKDTTEKETSEDVGEEAEEEEEGEIEENDEEEEVGAENDDQEEEEGEVEEEPKEESKPTSKTPEKGKKANAPTTKKGQQKSGKGVTAVKKKGQTKVPSMAARGRRGRGPGRGGARSAK